MAARKHFDGEELNTKIRKLPEGAPKMAALLDAIHQADEAKDHYWRLFFRYQYACEATFHDDPSKAIPIAAEFAPIFEEHPDALPEDGGGETYVMITQMGIDPIVNLPQIPMAQWEKLMEQYHALVKRFNVGHRTYWWQLTQFWQYVDREKAFGYFQRFWKTGRDGLSDCRGCERSYAVRMCLLMGDEAAAEECGKPLKAGRDYHCSDNPHRYWQFLLEYALDKGDLETAVPLANKLARKGNRDKSDLSYMGAVLRCWAYTDLNQAMEQLERRLEWTIGMWDQKKCYDFYKGAWVCCRELAKRQDIVELDLPKEFALYQSGGVYNCADLAQCFHDQAESIGRQFDKRNGSDYFARDLAAACACEGSSAGIFEDNP